MAVIYNNNFHKFIQQDNAKLPIEKLKVIAIFIKYILQVIFFFENICANEEIFITLQ